MDVVVLIWQYYCYKNQKLKINDQIMVRQMTKNRLNKLKEQVKITVPGTCKNILLHAEIMEQGKK